MAGPRFMTVDHAGNSLSNVFFSALLKGGNVNWDKGENLSRWNIISAYIICTTEVPKLKI